MWAVDSRSARKRQATHCIYSIFQPKQIFAPGVANIAQAEDDLPHTFQRPLARDWQLGLMYFGCANNTAHVVPDKSAESSAKGGGSLADRGW